MNRPADTGQREPGTHVLIESAAIGAGCQFGAWTHVKPGACLGDDVHLGSHVVVDAGAHLEGGSRVGHAVLVGRDVRVGERAFIGDRAVLHPGTRVGSGATVRAGAVVTRDVPPLAEVQGDPAQVVGFAKTPAVDLPADGATAPRAMPGLAVRGATLHRMPRIADARGSLSFGQVGSHLPFEPRRYFVVDGVPVGEVRGDHAHRALHQFLVCLRGAITAIVDDGHRRTQCVLDSPEIGLHMAPMVWGTQYRHTPDALLLVLASDVFQESDYIRDYATFLALARHDGPSP